MLKFDKMKVLIIIFVTFTQVFAENFNELHEKDRFIVGGSDAKLGQ